MNLNGTSADAVLLVLGPVVLRGPAGDISLGGLRQRRLLTALAVSRPAAVSRQTLVERVWGEGDHPQNAAASLRTYVSRLRLKLSSNGLPESLITTTDDGYRLDLTGVSVDADEFVDLIGQARGGAAADGTTLVDAALELWRGPPFGDCAEEVWARPEVARLDELAVAARELRLSLLTAKGANDIVIAEARALVAQHPWRDGVRSSLITALYGSGRTAEALAAFQDYRRALQTDLGLEPGPELQTLERRILDNDPDLLTTAAPTLTGYVLGEPIGQGAFSTVWRARQSSLDRDVAVKEIRQELADRPDFIRRFEAEAQLVARLEHPNAVPVHDYWREPGAAYVVMRYLRGGTLAERLKDGPLDEAAVLRLTTQIGGALQAAHDLGIVHRDVKPANVLLDRSGNFFLADFGIAALVTADDSDIAPSVGSPGYAAPEQLRGEAVTPSVDVYALGATVRSAVGAGTPLARRDSKLLPVLARALASQPSRRQPDIATFIDEISWTLGATADGKSPSPVPAARNPFRGLRPFEEVDADVFRGRERAVAEVLRRLSRQPVVAVVGASGSGKSSLVRAGVVPSLRADGIGDVRPLVALMVPGVSPFDRLAAALRAVSADASIDARHLRTGGRGALRRAVQDRLPGGGPLVLVIDQFEELFVNTSSDDRAEFLEELVDAVTAPGSPVRLLVTVRADRWDRPLGVPGLGELMANDAVHLAALGPGELQRAIGGPVESANCRFEDGLLGRLIHDAVGEPGALPMLQYTLTELYDKRDGDLLTNEAYDRLGGLVGAVATSAEAVHDDLDPSQRAAARRVFGLLAVSDTGSETRRRVMVERLTDPEAHEVLERFVAARLLVWDHDAVTHQPTVEIAHEALLGAWSRLRDWLIEDRSDRELHRQLMEASQRWADGGLDEADLLRGMRLEAQLEWVKRTSPGLGAIEADFLSAGQRLRHDNRDRERQRLRRLRLVLSATAVLLALVAVAATLAAVQWNRADTATGSAVAARESAETRRLVAEVAAATATSRELGLLLAVEAHRIDPSPATLGALQQALTRTGPFLGLLGAGTAYREIRWSGDGEFVYGLKDDGVDRLTPADGSRTEMVSARTAEGIALSSDGAMLAVSTVREGVVLVDTASGDRVGSLMAQDTVRTVDFDPSGRWLATGDRRGWLRLWDVATGEEVAPPRLAHGETRDDLPEEVAFTDDAVHEPFSLPIGVERVRFSPDGKLVLTTGGIFLRGFSTETLSPELDMTLDRPALIGDDRVPATPTDLDFVQARTVVVAAGRYVKVIDVARGQEQAEYLPALEAGTVPDDFDLEVSGDRVITSIRSGLLGDLDFASGRRRSPLIDTETRGSETLGVDVAVDPAGRRAAVAGDDGVRIFSLDGSGLIHRSVERPDWGETVQVSADGQLLMWTAFDESPHFYRLDQPALRPRVAPIDGAVAGNLDQYGQPMVLTPDGSMMRAHFLDRQSLTATGDGLGPGTFNGGDVSPDGRWLAVGRNHPQAGAVSIFDRSDLAQVAHIEPAGAEDLQVRAVAWHPDGVRLVAVLINLETTGLAYALVLDRVTGEVISPLITNSTALTEAVFSPDGRYLLTGDFSGRVIVRDAETFQPTGTELILGTSGLGAAGGRGLQFTEDGRYLVATIGAPLVVDVSTWTPVGGPFASDQGIMLGVPDGARFLPTVTEDSAVVWTIDPDRWVTIACLAAGRNLTAAEWRQYGPSERDLSRTCSEWS